MSKQVEGNPWISIWVEPRKTIRSIINTDPKFRFWVLSAAYGLPILFNFAQNLSLSAAFPLWAILLASLVICSFVGAIGISIGAWLFKVTGRWLGGKGTFNEIRSAVAWSNAPSIVSVAMWIALIAVFKEQVFVREFAEMTFIGYQAGVVFLAFLIQTIVSIWGFIILLKTLGEAQKFSAWKGLLNVVIPFAIIVGVVWILAGFMGSMNQLGQ